MLHHWPLSTLLVKAAFKTRRAWHNKLQRFVDQRRCSHPVGPTAQAGGRLQRRINVVAGLLSSVQMDVLRVVVEQHLRHRFDLLGSGWVEVRHGMQCRGVEDHVHPAGEKVLADQAGEWLRGRINAANLDMARRIWAHVSPGYVPIDWQLDFKSGYRWREMDWHLDIGFGHAPGVDIKVPWELARMQHLVLLAQAHALAGRGHQGFRPPGVYEAEFRNQVLDFMATNPPRFGVNWSCTMDVAIRAANLLVAWDLFCASGARFDPAFESLFLQSLYAHGLHVAAHLEWQPDLTTNHYLANIAGLLFVAAYLPASAQSEAWLAFGSLELIAEVGEQFHPDGSNFEASTCYHRLAAELVVCSTALVAGLRSDVAKEGGGATFPAWYWERLERMAEFTMDICRPDGRSPQIGDNDSGRLFKLVPSHRLYPTHEVTLRHPNLRGYVAPPDLDRYPLEDHGDHRHLVAAIHALVPRSDFAKFAADHGFDTAVIASLAGQAQMPSSINGNRQWRPPPVGGSMVAPIGQVATHVFEAPPATDLIAGLDLRTYPDFGIYIYRSDSMYLAVRCGPVGLKGLGAHAHNDPLSIELWLAGKPVVVDPGTYVYTAMPARRNAFRSVAVHFSPHFEAAEPAALDCGLFALGDDASPRCLQCEPTRFTGRYRAGPHTIYRQIRIDPTQLTVSDWSDAPNRKLAPIRIHQGPVSDGYGWLRTEALS